MFFTSYARKDAKGERLLRDFIDAVVANLAPMLGLEAEEIRFLDTQDIIDGSYWKEALAQAVAKKTKVIVCFCSKNYYNSEYCGKELAVFLERCEKWRKLPQNAHRQAPFIVPVLWAAAVGKPPSIFEELQLPTPGSDYPSDYIKYGLRIFILQNGTAPGGEYWRLVTRVTELIRAALAEGDTLPEFDRELDFHLLPSAFDVPVPGGASAVVLSTNAHLWRPFLTGPTAPALLSDTITPLGVRYRGLIAKPRFTDKLAESEQLQEALVVLINPLAVQDPSFEDMFEALNSAHRPNVAVLVAWGEAFATLASEERDALSQIIQDKLSVYAAHTKGLHDFTSLVTPELLTRKIQDVVTRIKLSLMLVKPIQRKAEDPQALAAARLEGIPQDELATLNGPGRAA